MGNVRDFNRGGRRMPLSLLESQQFHSSDDLARRVLFYKVLTEMKGNISMRRATEKREGAKGTSR